MERERSGGREGESEGVLDGERLRSLTCPVAVAELSSLGPVISKLCCLEVTAAHGHTLYTLRSTTHTRKHTRARTYILRMKKGSGWRVGTV